MGGEQSMTRISTSPYVKARPAAEVSHYAEMNGSPGDNSLYLSFAYSFIPHTCIECRASVKHCD